MPAEQRRAVVTGAAGFIGSHLSERLLADGWVVRGVDCFTPYYDAQTKSDNVEDATAHSRFELIDADLRVVDLNPVLHGADVVFHLAGQPGVRSSWSTGFADHLEHNLAVSQRLLEAAKGHDSIQRFVFASSSSVYGAAEEYPCVEATTRTRPISPYGISKLAVEHLCRVYATSFGLSTVSLRYFTVYGPRQRPDMALHRLIECGLSGKAFPKFGSGSQVRDFTFVEDVVDATVRAGTLTVDPGEVFNVAGGSQTSLDELIALVEERLGRPVNIDEGPAQHGDAAVTSGSIDHAADVLQWSPSVVIGDGVSRQIEWHRDHLDAAH
jgi:nucleoside-diphosphate-sugar epimerase